MSLQALPRNERIGIIAGLGAVSVASWAYLFVDAARMRAGHSCCEALVVPQWNHWPAHDLLMLLAMWAVMMVAMMTPTTVPMVLLFASINRQRREAERPYVPTAIFLLGYLLVWAGFSVIATPLQWAMHSAALLSPAMVSTNALLGGAVLIATGLFQFTPWKHACLNHCRSPLSFLMTDWRDGRRGALIMGLRHGLSCTGCCWLLMLLLFVVGVMNLLAVATLTLFVLIEKIAPWPRAISRLSGAACIVWGAVMMGMYFARV